MGLGIPHSTTAPDIPYTYSVIYHTKAGFNPVQLPLHTGRKSSYRLQGRNINHVFIAIESLIDVL